MCTSTRWICWEYLQVLYEEFYRRHPIYYLSRYRRASSVQGEWVPEVVKYPTHTFPERQVYIVNDDTASGSESHPSPNLPTVPSPTRSQHLPSSTISKAWTVPLPYSVSTKFKKLNWRFVRAHQLTICTSVDQRFTSRFFTSSRA